MTLTIDDTTWRTIRYNRNDDGSPFEMTPAGILIHSDEGTRQSSLPWLTTDPRSQVSCHYYVCRDGTVFQLADDTWRTWHAGAGTYDGLTDLNRMIGIECEHKEGGLPWTSVQLDALRLLCLQLIARWHIPQSRIIAHRWTKRPASATKKFDPTDWPDAELKPWIAALYEPNWQREFGDVPFFPEFGFGQVYMREYRAGRPLGKARGPERAELEGYTTQVLTNGILLYEHDTGDVRVYREQA